MMKTKIACKTYFGIRTTKFWNGSWGFGLNLVHNSRETYLNLDLFKLSINIGKLVKWENENE